MRIESCKKCGHEMTASTNHEHKCVVCSIPTKMFCQKCNIYSEVQFHTHVLDVYSRKQLLEMEQPTHVAAMAS